MKKKTIGLVFCIVLVMFACPQAVSQSRAAPLPIDSGLYEILESLYLEQGLALPSAARPYSQAEFRLALGRLDYERLSDIGRDAYRFLSESLSGFGPPVRHTGDGYTFRAGVELAAELYLHTNDESSVWYYDATRRTPFFSLPLTLEMFDSLVMYTSLEARKEPFLAGGDGVGLPLSLRGGDPDNFTNIYTAPYHADLNIPYRAAIGLGGENWNLLFGRDQASWGSGLTGNLLLSDAADWHDLLQFSAFWEDFRLSFLIIGLEPWILERGAYLERIQAALPGGRLEQFKMFFARRFEFRLFDRLQLALNEAIVYGGKYPDLRIFNPLNIFHNLYIKEWANSLISLEVDWTIVPGLNIHGQFALDQFATAYEQAVYGLDIEPNAMGMLAGLRLRRPGWGGYWGISLEFAHTDPWLYIREHSLVSFISTRRRQSESLGPLLGKPNSYLVNQPIGYPLGSDALSGLVRLEYRRPGLFDAFLEYRLILLGENRLGTGWDAEGGKYDLGRDLWRDRTPTGNAEMRNMVTLGGTWNWAPRQSVGAWLTGLHGRNMNNIANDDIIDVQLVLKYTVDF